LVKNAKKAGAPAPRHGHMMAVAGHSVALMFGGYNDLTGWADSQMWEFVDRTNGVVADTVYVDGTTIWGPLPSVAANVTRFVVLV
jgi:hypothetical protein